MELLRLETGFDNTQLSNLLILIMVCSGVFGFIYEELFYRIDLGYFTKRGSSYGPWIPIYVFGGAAYTLLVYNYKENPLTQGCGIITRRSGISGISAATYVCGPYCFLAYQDCF